MMQELVAIFGRKYSNFRKLINPLSKLSRGFGGGDSVISLVNGFEIQVLAGLKETIVENQPIIDFEFNSITRNGFGDLAGLNKLLPDYSFHGTRRVGLGLIKEKLKIIDFDFSKDYAHVIAVPKRFSESLSLT
jgi:hypothetical protein